MKKSKYNLKSRLSEVKLDMNDGRRVIINDEALYNFLDNGVEIDREKDIQMFQAGTNIAGKRRFEYGDDVSQGATLKFFSKIIIPSGVEGEESAVEKGEIVVTIPWADLVPKLINPDTGNLSMSKGKWQDALAELVSARIKYDENQEKMMFSKTLGISADAGPEEFDAQSNDAAFFTPFERPAGDGGTYTKKQAWTAFLAANGDNAWQKENKAKIKGVFAVASMADIAIEKQNEINDKFEKLLGDLDADGKEKLAKIKQKLSKLGPKSGGEKGGMKGNMYSNVGDALFLDIFMSSDSAQAAKSLLDACFENPPTTANAEYVIPEPLLKLAKTHNPSRSDTVGKGEFVSHFIWDDTEQNLGAADLDIVIDGVGWHVKAIAGAGETAPLGKQTFASSDVGNKFVSLAKKHGWSDFPREFAKGVGDYVEFLTDPDFPATLADAGGPANAKSSESITDESGLTIEAIASENAKLFSDLITKQMREANFGTGGSEARGVMFYDEDTDRLVFKNGEDLFAQNVSQSAHRVGKLNRNVGYYELAVPVNDSVQEIRRKRLWQWAIKK